MTQLAGSGTVLELARGPAPSGELKTSSAIDPLPNTSSKQRPAAFEHVQASVENAEQPTPSNMNEPKAPLTPAKVMRSKESPAASVKPFQRRNASSPASATWPVSVSEPY
jgi:hypothetical protein